MHHPPHYHGFDVMREAEEWDDHTREIVKKRLEPVSSFHFLNSDESAILRAIAATLIDDHQDTVLNYIVKHFDGKLQSKIGESQRKTGTPPEADLIRKGLAAIESTARNNFHESFPRLSLVQRQTLFGQIERGELPGTGVWTGIPQQDLFHKLLDLTVEAYYSHPTIWSEIGYAGPAYPRGYVRTELDLVDPWEPQQTVETENPKE